MDISSIRIQSFFDLLPGTYAYTHIHTIITLKIRDGVEVPVPAIITIADISAFVITTCRRKCVKMGETGDESRF